MATAPDAPSSRRCTRPVKARPFPILLSHAMHAKHGLLVIQTNRRPIRSGMVTANILGGIPETEPIAAGLLNVAVHQVCLKFLC